MLLFYFFKFSNFHIEGRTLVSRSDYTSIFSTNFKNKFLRYRSSNCHRMYARRIYLRGRNEMMVACAKDASNIDRCDNYITITPYSVHCTYYAVRTSHAYLVLLFSNLSVENWKYSL